MKMRVLVTLFAALALTVGVATATAGKGKGGNSAAAHACQHGGQPSGRSGRYAVTCPLPSCSYQRGCSAVLLAAGG